MRGTINKLKRTSNMTLAIISLFIFFHIVFILAIKLKDNSIVDVAWGLGFILLCICLLLQTNNYTFPQILVSALVLIWGTRLSAYLFFRKLGQPEDPRYYQWRISWGKFFVLRTYFQIFLLQMALLLLIASPMFLLFNLPLGLYQKDLPIIYYIGFIVSILGLAIEGISDYQMSSFKKLPQNKGKIMQSGLWGYSRHPNYFGESTFWWGIALIVYPFTHNFLCLVSPVTITILVRYISGVPMLEKKYASSKEFQDYAERTSCFLLWFPKKRGKNASN